MITKEQFKLIDGIFTPSEASRLLLSLVQRKIDYHRMEKLSNEERFGGDTAPTESRLRDLTALHASLKEYLALAAESHQTLEIKGRIEITPLGAIPSGSQNPS